MNKETKCRICDEKLEGKNLSNHIRKVHDMTSEAYSIKYIYNNVRPKCSICNESTRYSAFTFKTFCKDHSSFGESLGGKKGGMSEAWNKNKTKETDSRIVGREKEKNHFWGKKHSDDTKNKISLTKILSRLDFDNRLTNRNNEFELLTPKDEYVNRQKQYLDFLCKKCGKTNKKTLQAFERGSMCEFCFPIGSSQAEYEIGNWIQSLGFDVKYHDRTVISPKELDIVVHEKKIAIEFCGLYWHSELSPKEIQSNHHINKTNLCLKNGWKIIHVFSDEWQNKKEIIKSMIAHRLGITKKIFYARKCEIKKLETKERQIFFNKTHISGDVPAKSSWGLYYENVLVAALSVRTPRQKKWKNRLEIARYSTLNECHVVGGLSRLTKITKKYESENNIGFISYVDRRFGEGNGYISSGFTYLEETGADYWYTDGYIKFDRFIFRARDGKSERQIASENNVGKIFGCGNKILVLDF